MWYPEERKVLCRPKVLAASLEAMMEHLQRHRNFENFTYKTVKEIHIAPSGRSYPLPKGDLQDQESQIKLLKVLYTGFTCRVCRHENTAWSTRDRLGNLGLLYLQYMERGIYKNSMQNKMFSEVDVSRKAI